MLLQCLSIENWSLLLFSSTSSTAFLIHKRLTNCRHVHCVLPLRKGPIIGTRHISFIYIYKSLMLQNTAVFAPLFTFAPQKLGPCLSDQRRKKFPFFHKGKIKRLSSHQKMRSEQNQGEGKKEDEERVQTEPRDRLKTDKNHQSALQTVKSLDEVPIEIPIRVNDPEQLRSNRIVLPSVFDRKLGQGSSTKQVRSISSDHNSRSEREGRSSTIESKTRYRFDEAHCQALSRKLMTVQNNQALGSIQHKLGEKSHRKVHKKVSHAVNLPLVESNILEAIIRMKKIYN